MRIVGISASPHPEGNTAFALRYALEQLGVAALDTTYISLHDKTINHCEGCFVCRHDACVHDDDMTEINAALRDCDGIILASPVYMGMVTGKMKALMDRTVALRVHGDGFALSGKIGAGIACGGFRNGGQELTLQNMQTFFLQQNMLVIADGPGFSHSGATIVGRAPEDTVGLRTVENLCRNMVRMLRRGR